MIISLTIAHCVKFLLNRESTIFNFAGLKYISTDKTKIRVKVANNMPLSRENPIIMKLDTPVFHSIFTSELSTLSTLFKKYNYEIRIAGGAVRDLLTNKKPSDLDFATDATPDQMKEMFIAEEIRMINMKGEKHGTITARINDKENFEITTLRIDVVTDGRRAEVQFTKDWKLDANRRDLTINSMFLDLEGNVYDYFYGYDDLKKKRVVFVGDPVQRIQEDYLRILRYFRFYGRISETPDNHDKKTLQAIKENVEGLSIISGERIWSEWSKILEGKFGGELTMKMIECGVGKYIGLPDKLNMESFKTVYERALNNSIKLKPMTLVASMLKDEEELMQLHMRLKFSSFDRDLGLFVIKHREAKPCEKPLRPYQLLILQAKGKTEDARTYVGEVLKYRGAIELYNAFEKWTLPKFPLSGHLLKPHVPHPKMIGKIVQELKQIWFDSNYQMSNEDLLNHVKWIVEDLKEKKK